MDVSLERSLVGEVSGSPYPHYNVMEVLKDKKQKKEYELKSINEAIEALERNPEILVTLNLLRKVGV